MHDRPLTRPAVEDPPAGRARRRLGGSVARWRSRTFGRALSRVTRRPRRCVSTPRRSSPAAESSVTSELWVHRPGRRTRCSYSASGTHRDPALAGSRALRARCWLDAIPPTTRSSPTRGCRSDGGYRRASGCVGDLELQAIAARVLQRPRRGLVRLGHRADAASPRPGPRRAASRRGTGRSRSAPGP